jgi:hypothetical protein
MLPARAGGPRHGGITYFILPIDQPGMTVRLLRHILGENEHVRIRRRRSSSAESWARPIATAVRLTFQLVPGFDAVASVLAVSIEVHSPRSARITLITALISARWVSACGKFPRCRPVRVSISSAYRPSSLA